MGTIYWSWLWQAVDYLCQHVHNNVIIKHLMTPIFRPNLNPQHQDFCEMAKKGPSEICLIDVNQITLHKGIPNFVFVVASIKLHTFNKSYFFTYRLVTQCLSPWHIHPSITWFLPPLETEESKQTLVGGEVLRADLAWSPQQPVDEP